MSIRSFCFTVARSRGLWVVLGLLLFAPIGRGATVLGPWVPMFRGIEYAVGTNTAGGILSSSLQVAYFLRVDLTDPGIRLFASPRRTNWVANGTESYGVTATNFLKRHNLQVAINCNQFFLPGSSSSPGYTLAEGTAFNISGLLISEGMLVSPGDSADDASALYFATNNSVTFHPTNWPVAATAGVYTAISGPYAILYHGINIGSNYFGVPGVIHSDEPRTAFGLTQDKRYLILMVIDGRQNGYSVGAYDWETAEWLKLAGAYDGVNMDGGGSSCLVVQDSAGRAVPLNRDSGTASSGRERTVGAHFGIYAAPLPGFFTNIMVLPDDTAATITWRTTNAATTQLKYGLTTNLTSLTASNAALVADHAILLTNLTPKTGYYFAALASSGGSNQVSPMYYFVTTNYIATLPLFDYPNGWKYTTANLDGVNWKDRTYPDSGWEGEGGGVLWASINGPNGNIPATLTTEMPLNPGTDLPYPCYYFRTHFNFTNNPVGATLQLEALVDDGMVLYLNGVEIHRLRMPATPTSINNSTLASALAPCNSNAECPDVFTVGGQIIVTNLLPGDNVLAAEVHNYSTGSSDITFGLRASLTLPYSLRPDLSVTRSNGAVIMEWRQGGYALQHAGAPTGTWTDLPGPVVSSPFVTNNPASNRFFRLRK